MNYGSQRGLDTEKAVREDPALPHRPPAQTAASKQG
jgi:hypothetical protein